MRCAADEIESRMPCAKSGGVDNALPSSIGSPLAKTIVSVQVPPTSVATRYLRGFCSPGLRMRRPHGRGAPIGHAEDKGALRRGIGPCHRQLVLEMDGVADPK